MSKLQTYDVIVVGKGNAALCAALSARDQGASAAMLEAASEDEHGGNSRFAGGVMRFAYSSVDELKEVTEITEEQLQRTFQTNIFAMFYLVQAARPHLKKGAAIVNCTSVTMYKGSGGLLDYSATKGAITAFTRSLSENLIEDGIRVNAVAPGPIWTPLNPFGGAPPEKVEHFGEDTPMGRPGQPNEVAPAFLFLACEDSSYMSGQVLHPNGGIVVNG